MSIEEIYMNNINKAIVYIDGFNLYYGITSKGWNQYKWLDLISFSQTLIPIDHQLCQVRYFTSRITGDTEKHNRQQKYINAIILHSGMMIDIKYGNYKKFDSHCKYCQSRPVYCLKCGNEYSKHNEKKTDVNVTTAMLLDCFEKRTDCIILVSGDSDYETPLLEINRHFPGVQKIVAFPPKRRNPSLYKCCDQYFDITENSFKNCLLPNPVISPINGKKITKPSEWV